MDKEELLENIKKDSLTPASRSSRRAETMLQVANKIDQLTDNISKIGMEKVAAELSVIAKALKTQSDKPVENQLQPLTALFTDLKTAIQSIEVNPTIKVASSPTKVIATPVDVQPIVDAIFKLESTLTSKETEDEDDTTDRVIQGLQGVQDSINNLRFPVPNYVLPFTDSSTGKSTQARVDEDGSQFVQNGASFKDSFSGSSLDTTNNWTLVQSDGTTGQSVANSLLSITAGTTNGAYIAIRSKRTFKLPMRVQVIASLSQRIANNAFYIEIVNAAGTTATALATTAVSAGVTQAAYAFSSTTATNGTVVAQNQGVKGTADTTVTVATTANQSVYEIDCKIDSVDWQTRTTDVASASSLNATKRDRTILDKDEEYYIQLRSLNTGVPASGTTWNIESVLVENVTKLAVDITGGRGNISANRSLPVSVIAGTVTTVTTVTTLTNITNWGNIVDNAAFTDGTTRLMPGGYIFDEVAGTALTENDAAAARIDSKRAQIYVQEDATTRGQRQSINTLGQASVQPGLFPATTALNTYSARITTNTTTTPTSALCYVSSIAIATEVAGTTSTVSVRDKSGTPLHLVSSLTTVAITGAPTILTFDTPIKMTGGIDIVTAGAVAGTVDIWINYYQ